MVSPGWEAHERNGTTFGVCAAFYSGNLWGDLSIEGSSVSQGFLTS